MIVVATDAPLTAKDLKRVAARAIFAMARTGSTYSNGSGDFAIAFSTAAAPAGPPTPGPPDSISALFEATLDATEEAIYNSILKATDTTGNGRTIRALPIDELTRLLQKYGRQLRETAALELAARSLAAACTSDARTDVVAKSSCERLTARSSEPPLRMQRLAVPR